MKLYTAPIQTITWEDIELFCQERIREGAYLDYKQEISSNTLAKTIAAMANTFGGIILIGVKEDDESKPILPLEGMDFSRGLSETITRISITAITPPVFLEIQVCANEDQTKALILVRVPESNSTPHAIQSNTRAYLRTGDVNKPEALAKINEIEWLQHRRKKSEEFKRTLYENTEEMFPRIYQLCFEQRKVRKIAAEEGWLSISLCPLYPGPSLATPPELWNIFDEIRNDAHTFPVVGDFQHLLRDAVVRVRAYTDDFAYCELNRYGLFFYREALGEIVKDHVRITNLNELMTRLTQYLDSAEKFYSRVGYKGFLEFSVKFSGLNNVWLRQEGGQPVHSLHKNFAFQESYPPLSPVAIRDIIDTLAIEISWTYGRRVTSRRT